MPATIEESRGVGSGLASDLAGIAARLSRSTVQVHGGRARSGSGVIWEAGGLIVTNAHVARAPARVVLADGRAVSGRVLAWDRACDLAALAIDADDLPAVIVGDSDGLRVGDLVLAVGHALGLPAAVTAGVIHALSSRGRRSGLIQADLRLAPGNSGGPLADARGRVVGINTMIAGGLACAVPSRVVERFLAAARHETLAAT
jgi:serine protease Do